MAVIGTDNFTGSDLTTLPTHDATWVNVIAGAVIYSNGVTGNVAGLGCARWNATTPSKHYAKLTLSALGTDGAVGPAIRCQSGASSFYYALFDRYTSKVYCGETIAGTATDWDAGLTAPTVGTVIELSVDPSNETTILYKENGVTAQTYTGKSALSGGYTGVCTNLNNHSVIGDDWEGGSVAVAASGEFVYDTFTGTQGTLLSAHTGEEGTPWIQQNNLGAGILAISNNRVTRSGTVGNAHVYATGSAAGADYTVACDIYVATSTSGANVGVCNRFNTNGSYFYLLRHDMTLAAWAMLTYMNGAFTTLSSVSQTLNIGSSYTMELGCSGSVLTAYVQGSAILQAVNTSIPDTGKAGIRFGGAGNFSTGYHLDNFVATDMAVEVAGYVFIIPRGSVFVRGVMNGGFRGI